MVSGKVLEWRPLSQIPEDEGPQNNCVSCQGGGIQKQYSKQKKVAWMKSGMQETE